MNKINHTAKTLRVVNNNTRDYFGGYSVEAHDGSVFAGPYITKEDAKQAKADLISGRPVKSAN